MKSIYIVYQGRDNRWYLSNGAIWRFWAELIPFLAIVGLTLLFWQFEKKNVHLHITSLLLKN